MKKAPETYADYLKRVSGFADFVPFTQEKWEAETNQSNMVTVPIDQAVYPVRLRTESDGYTTM
jgi:hypothetical protein